MEIRSLVYLFLVYFCVIAAKTFSASDDPRSLGLPVVYIPEQIPGTNLQTATFYSLNLLKFPLSKITWSNDAHSSAGTRWTITDNDSSKFYQYQKGGQLYYHHQWYFLPAKGYSGWYHLANRGIPGEFAGWNINLSRKDKIFHLILDPYYSMDQPKPEYLFRVIQVGSNYQLKTKALPDAPISWINGYKNRHYITIFNINEPKFYKGNEWYNDTILQFEPISNFDKTKYHATITKFQFLTNLNETENTKDLDVEEVVANAVLRNNGPATISETFSKTVDITERVYVQRPAKFADFHSVAFQNITETEDIPVPLILKSEKFLRPFFAFLMENRKNEYNFTSSREYVIQQMFEIPQCTEYYINAIVKTVTDYPLEYEVHYQLSGEQNGELIQATEIQKEHFMQNKETGSVFIDILDDYKVFAKVKGKLWITHGMNTLTSAKGSVIENCQKEFSCIV